MNDLRVLVLAILLAGGGAALAADPVPQYEPEPDFEDWEEPGEDVETPPPEPLHGHMSFGIGLRTAGDSSSGFAATLDVDVARREWPFALVFLMSFAAVDPPDTAPDDASLAYNWDTFDLIELGVGLRKRFNERSSIRPFVGIGGTFYVVRAADCYYFDCTETLDRQTTVGPFGEAGVEFDVGPISSLVVRGRYTVARVDVLNNSLDLSGLDAELAYGMRW